MAIRRLALRPKPETGHVSREEHVQAFMDLESQMWFSGGVGSVVVNRAPTDVEGEMVTTFAVLEWKDRTNARAQAEQAVQLADEAPAPEQAPQAQQQAADALSALSQQIGLPPEEIVAALAAHAAGENGNGATPATAVAAALAPEPNPDGARDEPEEDVSSIPEHLR